MVKSEPKKKPQSGGFFQKFFRKPEKSQKEQRLTVQRSIPYLEMGRDGICRVEEHLYSKTVRFYDINYQLAQADDQSAIFDGYCAFLNSFDSSLPFQLSFINHRSRPESKYKLNIPTKNDEYSEMRSEYVEMLEGQIAKSNNGIVRTKLLTFGVSADSLAAAKPRLERVEADITGNFKKLGVQSRPLNGLERLEILHGQLHPGGVEPFRFTWDMIPKTGMGTKDFIAPTSFDFRQSRLFRMGSTWGAASYMQIMASELSDKLLAELLEVDAEMTITMHIQTVDQAKAIKTIKGKVSDIDKMKVEEQKKAVRSGYDMDILPPDLVTFSQDAKNLLNDLQSRNERMFLLTFLVVNTAATRRELDNDLFTVSGIMQKYNCVLKRLDFQQEQGLVSSLPLGYNGIEIQRGMTTSSTAIFVPFMTQELRMDGEAIYYGLNALSHNVIMANRKKLKNPNGLYLGVPGSGKSFSGKRELVNVFLATNDRIIILDPMGEYSPLVRQFGRDGLVVEIAPNSPHHINPMDLDLSMDDEVSPISLKCDFILSLMELIVGGKDGLQPVERTIIDRCARMVYRDLLNDPEHTPMPTLQDLYDLLCQQAEPEAKRLATALEIYVSGSLNLFNHKTKVRRVVVYKLDRISRSILDFANMMELFQEYDVEFVSSTEKFDTSTPMGRAMLNICIVFAQLERETIQKRVTDAYYSRCLKGFHMSGQAPYGFELEPTVVEGIRTKMMAADPVAANHVRLMFEMYAEPETSFGDITRYFEEQGIKIYGKSLTRPFLSQLLRNPVYAQADLEMYEFFKSQGAVVVNDAADFAGTNGCYLYQGRDVKEDKDKSLKDQILVIAPHEGFVPSDIWLRCRKKLMTNITFQNGRKARNTWLAGKIKCGKCGYALKTTHNPSGYEYLRCSKRADHKGCPGCGTLRKNEFEQFIFTAMGEKFREFKLLRGGEEKANPKITAYQVELAQVEAEIEKLLDTLTGANATLLAYANKKIEDLDNRRKTLSKAIADLSVETLSSQQIELLSGYLDDWENISFEDKRKAADGLISSISATSDYVKIEWKI